MGKYIIFWERTANSGLMSDKYFEAESHEDAVEKYGFSPEYVRHTVVEIGTGKIKMIGNRA